MNTVALTGRQLFPKSFPGAVNLINDFSLSEEDKSMKNNIHGTSRRRARVFIASALALTISAGGSAALASEVNNSKGKSIFVSGNSTFSDTCGLEGSDFALLMTGDLEGCLSGFIQGYTCKELEDYDLYFENGREVFVGRLHGKWGRFRTTYTFEGVYAKGFCQSFDPSLQLGGGCDHKINGGRRVFSDAEGLIKFIDVIANVTGDPLTGEFMYGSGANNFLYYGRIGFDQDD